MTDIDIGSMHIETREPLKGDRVSYYCRDRQLTIDTAKDIDRFFETIYKALQDYYEVNRVIAQDRFIFVPRYPSQMSADELKDKPFNYITYRLVHRQPGPLCKTAGGRRNAPFQFDSSQDPNYAGYVLTDDVTWRDNLVQFDIQSTSSALADEFALWFENNFFRSYKGTFERTGFQQMFFKERLEDRVDLVYDKAVYVRPLRYKVSTQIVITKSMKTLDSIEHTYEL